MSELALLQETTETLEDAVANGAHLIAARGAELALEAWAGQQPHISKEEQEPKPVVVPFPKRPENPPNEEDLPEAARLIEARHPEDDGGSGDNDPSLEQLQDDPDLDGPAYDPYGGR